jgi:ethanolamine utilization protein EutA
MHDIEFSHVHVTPEESQHLSETIWSADNVELTTVGIDVGSSTSHLMFARVHLQRLATGLSSRFVVAERQVLWRSPILLTPYQADSSIDAAALGAFVEDAYAQAGLRRSQVDSGAVILTGEALKRVNAKAIADRFAETGGGLVCATAGHHLEASLAAHGSGAVALSRQKDSVILNVDIGGGTTKFALVRAGEIIATSAIAVPGTRDAGKR